MSKVLTKICEEIKEKDPKSLIILYTTDDLLKKAQAVVAKTFGNIETEAIIISPVIGTHAGPRAVGIGYLEYEK